MPQRLTEIVNQFRGRVVAVLGDLVADEFLHGDIARISREAPVLILEHRRTVSVPGGAGNAVANLRALGAHPLPVGVLGKDEAGRRLRKELRRRRIDCSGIVLSDEYSTPSKSRVLAGGVHTRRQQIVRIDRGGLSAELSAGLRAQLRRSLAAALKKAEGLLVADYGYGAATPEILADHANRIERRRLPLLVDSRSRVTGYRGATACTPNQEEVERALDLPPIEEIEEIERAGRAMLRRTGNQAVLVTRGSRGMSLFQRRKPAVHVPAFGTDEVADVTGAGDTVLAAFGLAVLAGADMVEATRLANYAAGLVVLKAGTATIEPAELLRAIREDKEVRN